MAPSENRSPQLPKRRRWKRGLVLGAAVGVVLYVLLIHSFLAISRPVAGEVLVVEGWFWDRPAMQEAAERFSRGNYRALLCVGGPSRSADASPPSSYADLAAKRLAELGVPAAVMHALPVAETERHRTFGMALVARDWLAREMPDARAVDVFSLGAHARKSHVLFRKALGSEFRVGIIAGTESAYHGNRWWSARAGWYIVLRNTFGYLYALVLNPGEARPASETVQQP